MTGVRVLLVDDQALFREALATLLAVHEGVEVVGEAGDGDEALRKAAELAPDVVLMDLRMPVLDGIAATRRLRVEQPAVRVIALTTFDDDEDVFAALRAGAVGYLLKDVSSARLVEAVLAAARGESVLQPSVAARVVARVAVPRLADHLDVGVDGQERRQRLAEQCLVVHQQHPHGAHPGTSMRTVHPAPGADSTCSRPPRCAARSRRPSRPNPVVAPSAVPVPSSLTSTRTAPSA